MTVSTIENRDDLLSYLNAAMALEHATIPPYLTAYYSIHSGTNSDAAHIIRVIAVEEMLHLTLVANVLNAIGGEPDLTRPGFVPSYPAYLPDGENDFTVDLRPFSPEAVETFCKIERPGQAPGAGLPADDDIKQRNSAALQPHRRRNALLQHRRVLRGDHRRAREGGGSTTPRSSAGIRPGRWGPSRSTPAAGR